jgi:hypothetical protein
MSEIVAEAIPVRPRDVAAEEAAGNYVLSHAL